MLTKVGLLRSGSALLSPALRQTGLLFALDILTNATDYGFHIYLGRALPPGDFAQVQTVNSLVLIIVATFSVLQPVIARYAAANQSNAGGYFQRFTIQSLFVGLAIAALLFLLRVPIAAWLNIPDLTIVLLALMLLVAVVRPVFAGMLQGRAQFAGFGLVRSGFAFGRFLFAFLFITLFGTTAVSAVAAYPVGGLISLIVALAFLGRGVWQKGAPVAAAQVWSGWQLSGAAFLAYAAFMSLQNVDLIWVNRLFSAEIAGQYASAVVLRRVLAVLPGAVTVILYPRIVKAVNEGQQPDQLIRQAMLMIAAPTLILVAIYAILGAPLVQLVFGTTQPLAASLLTAFGIGMFGYSIATVWLNVFLATRPRVFVAALVTLAGTQIMVLSIWQSISPNQIANSFAIGGILSAGAGWLLYKAILKPGLNTGIAPT